MRSPGLCAMRLRPLPPVLLVSAALLGCAGNVFQEVASGAGGAPTTGTGSTTTSTWSTTSSTWSTTTSTWSTSTADCQALASAYEATLAQASECDACGNVDGCVPGVIYTDTCGCEVVLNTENPGGPSVAKMAYWDWKMAGCAPSACPCPPLPGIGWSCKPTSPGSCAGRCAP